MYLCMFVQFCIQQVTFYVYICIFIYIYTYLPAYRYMHVYMCMSVYMYDFMIMNVHDYVCMHMYILMRTQWIWAGAHVHQPTYAISRDSDCGYHRQEAFNLRRNWLHPGVLPRNLPLIRFFLSLGRQLSQLSVRTRSHSISSGYCVQKNQRHYRLEGFSPVRHNRVDCLLAMVNIKA